MKIKQLLKEHDVVILRCYSEGWGGWQPRCLEDDVCPAISARDYKDPLRIMYEEIPECRKDTVQRAES